MMNANDTPITGHVSPETAHITYQYPFGSSRCLMRTWVETAEKGAKKGEQRVVTQTTAKGFNCAYTEKLNAEGAEVANKWADEMVSAGKVPWNKPHGAVYSLFVGLYLSDMDDGSGRRTVKQAVLTAGFCRPDSIFAIRRFYGDTLTPHMDEQLKRAELFSRRYNPDQWDTKARILSALGRKGPMNFASLSKMLDVPEAGIREAAESLVESKRAEYADESTLTVPVVKAA